MIAVIADDFTGAAEIAGIALRYGLRVKLCVGVIDDEVADVDIVIVSTDSRSLKMEGAIAITEKTARQLKACNPSWVFKKTDSVLRGYVVGELLVHMQVMDVQRCLLIPANPSLGRTIRNGQYLINNKPIDETPFRYDPEFPLKTSSVVELLKGNAVLAKVTDDLPLVGIVVGEATSVQDVQAWANKLDASWLLAGAGDFFTSLLQREYNQFSVPPVQFLSPHLYVCGTAFLQRKEFIRQLHEQKHCVLYLPIEITGEWLTTAQEIMLNSKRLVIAIDDEYNYTAFELRKHMAMAVKQIVNNTGVNEIFIEGGSTTTAIFNEMNITTLIPVHELNRGVVRARAAQLFFTVKPGSYELPQEITALYN